MTSLHLVPLHSVWDVLVEILIENAGVVGIKINQQLFGLLQLIFGEEGVQLCDDWRLKLDSRGRLEGIEGVEVVVLTQEFENEPRGLHLLGPGVLAQSSLDQRCASVIITRTSTQRAVLPAFKLHVPDTEIEIGPPRGKRDNLEVLDGEGGQTGE